MTRSDLHHLLVIGAYRDNEVDPLIRSCASSRPSERRREGSGRSCSRRSAANISSEFIADALRCDPERAAPLAQLVHEKTGGNPFFAIQFLSALADEGLVALRSRRRRVVLGSRSHPRQGPHGQRRGPDGRQADPPAGRNADRAAAARLSRQCCRDAILSIVLGSSEEQVHAALWEAARHDLVERSTAPTGSSTTECRKPPIH